jgi:hypothetical protein
MTIRPCRRPKVDVFETSEDRYAARCEVPACGWHYPVAPGTVALKTDVAEQARHHRADHSSAYPRCWIERDVEWEVHCAPCGGHRRTFGTRRQAQTWLDAHLQLEHQVVVCA